MLSKFFQNLKVIVLIVTFVSSCNYANADEDLPSNKNPIKVPDRVIEKSITQDLKLALTLFNEFLEADFTRMFEEYNSNKELEISNISSLKKMNDIFDSIDRKIKQLNLERGFFYKRTTLKWNYQNFLEEVVTKLALTIQRLEASDEILDISVKLKLSQLVEELLHLIISSLIEINKLTEGEVRGFIEQNLLIKLRSYDLNNDELKNIETGLALIALDVLRLDFSYLRNVLLNSKVYHMTDNRVRSHLVKLFVNSANNSNQSVWKESKFKTALLNNSIGISDRKATLRYNDLEKLLIESINSIEDYKRALETAQEFSFPFVYRALVGLSEHFSVHLGIRVENERIFLNYFTATRGYDLTEHTGASPSEIDWRELTHLVDFIIRVNPSENVLSRAVAILKLSPYLETQQYVNQITEDNKEIRGQLKTNDTRMNELTISISKVLQAARATGNYSSMQTFFETNFNKIEYYFIELIRMTVNEGLISSTRSKLEPFVDILVESYFLFDTPIREQIWNLLSVPQSLIPELDLDRVRVKIFKRIFKNLKRIYYDSVDKNNCNEHVLNIFAELYIRLLRFIEDLIEQSGSSKQDIYKKFLFGESDLNELLRSKYLLWKQLYPEIGNKIVQANHRYLQFGKNIKVTRGTCIRKVTIGR